MVPTSLLVGLVAGALIHDRLSLAQFAVVAIIASLIFGIVVGVADSSLVTFVGGTGLALANCVVGAALSAAVRNGGRLLTTSTRPRT